MRRKEELKSELAQEIYTATTESPREFNDAVINIGLDPEKFVDAVEECFPIEDFTLLAGAPPEIAEMYRVFITQGIVIGMQMQQNRIFSAMDEDETS